MLSPEAKSMEYTVKRLSELSGVSVRTLHYYDAIGLLSPARVAENGYRLYGQTQVDILQQILFYRSLDMPLEKIRSLLTAPDFDRERALEMHLTALQAEKARTETLILTVEKTLRALKGEAAMTDQEKFEGFKQKWLDENEKRYGGEARKAYGAQAVEASEKKVRGMSKEAWDAQQALSERTLTLLRAALAKGDPACEEAREACEAHKKWLCMFWKDGAYSPKAHRALADTYVTDPRFTRYYDENAGQGAAAFFKRAIDLYTA